MTFDDNEHDHDDEDDGDVEFEVNIEPDDEALERHRIDHADFETALYAALEAQGESLQEIEGDDVTNSIGDIELTIHGKPYRLAELANVSIEQVSDAEDDQN